MSGSEHAVRPVGMEILMFYPCPYCTRKVPVLAPLQPSVVECDSCRKRFPVVPMDAKTIRFIRMMMAGGPAGVNPEYI